jgi:hypothetical protein
MFTQITIRLTQRQAEILYPALRLIAINWECLSKTGRSPGAHPDVMNLGFLKRRGVFNREFLETALAIWKTLLRKRRSECRLKVNYIGIAACLLAVRVTLQRLRHKHLQPWADHLDLTANRLVRKLEAMRWKIEPGNSQSPWRR